MSSSREPRIVPGLYLKKDKVIMVDGKPVVTVKLERDVDFKVNKKPSYRIDNPVDDKDIQTA